MSNKTVAAKETSKLSIAERQNLERSLTIPLRPDNGKIGKGIRVLANYFQVSKLPVGEIVQYDVSFNPDAPKNMKHNIFTKAESQYGNSAFGGKLVAYDGQANVYSLGTLPKKEIVLDVGVPGKHEKDERRFQVRLRQVSSVNMATLEKFLTGKLDYTPHDVITALEVIIRHQLANTNVIVARSAYNGQNSEAISGGLEVWKGIFSSLRPGNGRLLLNVDTTLTAFYSHGSVVDVIGSVLNIRSGSGIGKLSGPEFGMVERLLRGVKIETNHRGPTYRRRYRVLGLSEKTCSETFFEGENGTISVAEYFEQKYNVKLNEPDLPCLVVGSTQRAIFFPVEICSIPPGQRYPRKLDENQTNDMIKVANQKPHVRFNMIKNGINIFDPVKKYLDNFQIEFGRDLVQANARVLPTPKLFYNVQGREPEVTPSQGVWNLKDKKVEIGSTINSWAVLVFGRANENEIRAFINELVITCQDTGLSFSAPARQPPILNAQGSPDASCKAAFTKAKSVFNQAPQLILCVLPSTESFLYGEIKRCTDTVLGIPSQCMQMKHARRPNKQYCANLCLKINLKLGGTNMSLGKQLGFITAAPTMVIGADVTHPSADESEKPSIAAVVASYDIKLARYGANVRVQGCRKEIIEDIKEMVKEHIENFAAIWKVRPKRILFYRDGVSEGQFSQVLQHELNSIKAGFTELDPNYHPTITMILVQKRHHTRFAPINQQDGDRSGNVPAGTVVDTSVCHPNQFDFFLCSHAGVQGTSRPTHYHVVYDDHKFSADELQTLSYNLCYTFGRCTRSVSVVTPAYYAHLVAFRARFHFDPKSKAFSQVTQNLRGRMYFI